MRPPQGPDVCVPKIVACRRGNTAARAVIGPLTKTRRRNIKVHGSKRLRGHYVAFTWNHNQINKKVCLFDLHDGKMFIFPSGYKALEVCG